MKRTHSAFAAGLLATTMFAPVAFAQDASETAAGQPEDVIVVRYQYIPEDKRVTSEVSSFLDVDDIAVAGDADLAGALTRITGISLSDGRFPIVRGLNERYSNTLLNGSPMPSPEPLRRATPLDLFPTNIVNSVLVQKTFSPQYPGEFGGGLIEIETTALPDEGFFSVSVGGSWDTETTNRGGLMYHGSDSDWTGFDDGTRDLPDPIAAVFNDTRIIVNASLPGGGRLDEAAITEIGRSLVNSELSVIQNADIDGNGDFSLTAGNRYDYDGFSVGVIGTFSYSNDWETRRGTRGRGGITGGQLAYINGPATSDRGGTVAADAPTANFLSSENEINLNALGTVGVEIGDDHEISLTGLILRSTSKEARSDVSYRAGDSAVIREDTTSWFERQTVLGQLSGEHFFPQFNDLTVNWRASTAEAERDAPYLREFRYELDDLGYFYSFATDDNLTEFSLVEDSTNDIGIDFELPLSIFGGRELELRAGFSRVERDRDAYRRSFSFAQIGAAPAGLERSRIDYIYSVSNISSLPGAERFELVETGGLLFPSAYRGELNTQAFYAGFDAEINDFLRIALGARFEDGEQLVDTFGFPRNPQDVDASGNSIVERTIEEDYVLPAATLTWTFADNLQLRVGYSQTVARPQFRELAYAEFFNTETDQRFIGNPFLVNSEIESIDARLEWYFGRDQFLTAGVFFKTIENPIEEFINPAGDDLATSFINAPEAELRGIELEFERVFDFSDQFDNWFFNNHEIFLKTNVTYIDSEVSSAGQVSLPNFSAFRITESIRDAAGFVEDGRPLQGQSEWLGNLQLGYEALDGRSRGALLVNYTGERQRAVADLSNNLPAITEELPITVDLVFSNTHTIFGADYDFGISIRNLFGDDYVAYQEANGTQLIVDSYAVGTTFGFSVGREF